MYKLLLCSIVPWVILIVARAVLFQFSFEWLFIVLYVLVSMNIYILHTPKWLSMVSWNKCKRFLELLLLVHCGWYGIPLGILYGLLLFRANALVTTKLMEPSLYSSLCLYQMDLGGVLVGLISAPKLFSKDHEVNRMPMILKVYYFRNIVQMWYLYLNVVDISVLPSIVCCVLFWVYLYLCMEPQKKIDVYKYHDINHLPDNYPIPFDFRNAIVNCDVARKVFKEDGV